METNGKGYFARGSLLCDLGLRRKNAQTGNAVFDIIQRFRHANGERLGVNQDT